MHEFLPRFNKELYDRVIEACALKSDLEMLPAGDQEPNKFIYNRVLKNK